MAFPAGICGCSVRGSAPHRTRTPPAKRPRRRAATNDPLIRAPVSALIERREDRSTIALVSDGLAQLRSRARQAVAGTTQPIAPRVSADGARHAPATIGADEDRSLQGGVRRDSARTIRRAL